MKRLSAILTGLLLACATIAPPAVVLVDDGMAACGGCGCAKGGCCRASDNPESGNVPAVPNSESRVGLQKMLGTRAGELSFVVAFAEPNLIPILCHPDRSASPVPLFLRNCQLLI